jgi:hypothetical protein
MALEAKNINNATDMRNYVEGCLNDLVEGLSTVEETMVYMKEYTHRIIDLASESQKHDTSGEALPIADVVEPKGKLKCGNCGSIKLRKSLRNQKVYCLECKHKWQY